MDHAGKRLESWRESLPGGPISARSLAVALEWEESRWWRYERMSAWNTRQAEHVRDGVVRVLGMLEADDEAHARALAWIAGELDELPAAPPRWRDGLCPALPVGRRTGSRVIDGKVSKIPDDDGDDDGPRPLPPEPLRKRQVAAIVRSLLEGDVDEQTAVDEIGRVYAPLCAVLRKAYFMKKWSA